MCSNLLQSCTKAGIGSNPGTLGVYDGVLKARFVEGVKSEQDRNGTGEKADRRGSGPERMRTRLETREENLCEVNESSEMSDRDGTKVGDVNDHERPGDRGRTLMSVSSERGRWILLCFPVFRC